jgi:hypothetical protein
VDTDLQAEPLISIHVADATAAPKS